MEQPLRIVLFDGVCNFCNYWVQFALKRDKNNQLWFASLQGQTAKDLLPQYGIDPAIINSVIFIDQGKAYTESSAVLQICRYLDGGWKIFSLFRFVPAFIRDGIYPFIGKNRYKWFGKRDSCLVPTAEMKSKFLD